MTNSGRHTRATVDETRTRIYQFIVRYISEHSFSPSIREICRGVDIASTSTIHNHLKTLQNDGLLDIIAGKRRTIRIARQDEAHSSRVIPLVGRVAAGKPILATENIERYVAFPFGPEEPSGSFFALAVQGDSMVDAAILDGDIVIVEKRETAGEGDIIVALLDDEATVKTLRFDSRRRAYLHPENTRYRDIPFDPESSKILGIVRGLIRKSF